jgi:hypothetical protein
MNKSKASAAFLKVIPVIGSIILFLAWVFQQTLLGDANSTLQRINSAQSVFQTYQSNNALFNAILKTTNSDSQSVAAVRAMQIYNYDLGLRELEALLTDQEKADLPEQPNPFSGTPDTVTMMSILQTRIDMIQGKLEARKAAIATLKSTYNKIFLGLYVIGTLTVLSGSMLNALSSSRPTEVKTQAGNGKEQPKS